MKRLRCFFRCYYPKEVMRELLKGSKRLTHEEAMRRMKQAAEDQKKKK